MKNPKRCAAAALTLLAMFVSPSAPAAGDADRGRLLANTCMGCHGIPSYTNAYPTYRVPKLGGQSEGLIVAALKAYKSGERAHKTMQAQAANLSEQDMADIAAYLTQAPAHEAGQAGGGLNTELEQAQACAACHGPNGAKPITPEYPVLAGQYSSYLEHSLREYKSGARKNPIMASQVAGLSNEDLEKLAKYFASQQSLLYTPVIPGKPAQ